MQDVVAKTDVAYDGMRKGALYLHRSQASLDRGAATMQILKEAGRELEVIDRERAAAIDPALAASKDNTQGARGSFPERRRLYAAPALGLPAADDARGHAGPRPRPSREPLVNTSHGHLGWTMACGTARACADLIAGRPPEVPLEGLTLR